MEEESTAKHLNLDTWIYVKNSAPGYCRTQISAHFATIIDSEAFIDFIRTLGLRNFEGKNKAAFDMIREQTAARKW